MTCVCASLIAFYMLLVTFPLAYVTCSYGVEWIGYITMARGIAGLMTCISLGLLGQKLPRTVWLSFPWFFITAKTVTLLLWHYISKDSVFIMLIIISILSGLCNSVNLSQFTGKVLTYY